MRILCFGDSNTYGYDPRGYFGDRYGTEDRWVDLLAKQTGHECINAGANGREIPRNPYALRLLTEQQEMDIFLVMLGTNDLLQGATAKEAADQMESFLRPLLPHWGKILLVAPPPINADKSQEAKANTLVKPNNKVMIFFILCLQNFFTLKV